MKNEIIDKLGNFLETHSPIGEEYEAVYIMVELRKLLDRLLCEGMPRDSFSLFRFYADWTVHTRKNGITQQIRKIMNKVDENLDHNPQNGDLSFLSMLNLRGEMWKLFKQCDLPTTIFETDNWLNFAIKLSQVLADQPIINPTKSMAEFNYVNEGNGEIGATIDFTDERGSITLGGVSGVV